MATLHSDEKYPEAAEVYTRILAIYEDQKGSDLGVAKVKSRYAACRHKLGDHKEGLELAETGAKQPGVLRDCHLNLRHHSRC